VFALPEAQAFRRRRRPLPPLGELDPLSLGHTELAGALDQRRAWRSARGGNATARLTCCNGAGSRPRDVK
jgi:hypothetical protein